MSHAIVFGTWWASHDPFIKAMNRAERPRARIVNFLRRHAPDSIEHNDLLDALGVPTVLCDERNAYIAALSRLRRSGFLVEIVVRGRRTCERFYRAA